jgi:putative ABC transport system ATP-binding protein
MATVIELKELSKIYGFGESSVVALDAVDLTVEKGEFVAIMGPSGSGKSTLMNLIGLLDRSSHGVYKLDGRDVSKLRPRKRARVRRDHVGFVFQSFNLISNLTVLENVALPLAYKGMTMVKRLKKAAETLEKVGLTDRQYYFPRQLSGGQAQRTAIARALVNWPSIVLADEPTGNLDSATSLQIMELLKDIHKGGNTILMVTHNPELTRYATRVIYMKDGQIQYDEELKADEAIDLADVPAAVEYEQELLGKRPPKKKKRGGKRR